VKYGTAPLTSDWPVPAVSPVRQRGFEAFLREGPDLLSRHTPDGRFVEASPAAAALVGRCPPALLGLSWLDIVDGSDRDRVAAWWRLVRSGPQPPLSFRIQKPDGDIAWVEAAAVAVRSSNGGVVEMQVMTRDVTRHLGRVEEARRRADRLERANRELGAFAADVAHDMRSPLQAISGFAELLARREGARLDETSQSFVAHILAATAGIQELVHAMLEHRQSTSVVLEPAPVNCATLVRAVLIRVQGELDETGAEVEIGELPVVMADRVQLGRVFQNLISNALRFTLPDQQPRLTISARRLAGQWELSVADNGIGVPEYDRERIFDLFQRGEAPGSWRSGHGLGLSICRAVVERHGGRVGLERVPEGGTRFFFTLPDSFSSAVDSESPAGG
jgi:PAS domain S-box-containing protein